MAKKSRILNSKHSQLSLPDGIILLGPRNIKLNQLRPLKRKFRGIYFCPDENNWLYV